LALALPNVFNCKRHLVNTNAIKKVSGHAVLMLHGSQDLVCRASDAEGALIKIQSKDKTWVLIDGAYYNLDSDWDKTAFEQ
jgi:hypothetical protein